jgi:hypothetical protein
VDRELRRLRSKIASAPKDANEHRRFGAELRAELVAYARGQIEKRETQQAIAESLGIGSRLLWRWLQRADATIREVVLEPERAPEKRSERRLVLRGGVEIVGLELDELIAIARALS